MIQSLDEPNHESLVVEFVGGPREPERATLEDRVADIVMPDGLYRRSVRCAVGGALRYVWKATLPVGVPE